VNVRLLSNDPETPTTRRIRLALDGAPFEYRAGQAAALSAGGGPTPYSIASAPVETGRHGWLEFLIKIDGANRFGAIVERLAAGTTVTVDGPVGTFTPERAAPTTPLLFVAGGTGIAPLRSMLVEMIAADHAGPIALHYSARTPAEFAYLRELQTWEQRQRLQLSLTLTRPADDWIHLRGRTGAAHLAELVRPGTLAFVCGPPAMVTDIPAALVALGVPRDRIVTEHW
jgi:CDP-4-dehydro-6-deoxyglucose reductase